MRMTIGAGNVEGIVSRWTVSSLVLTCLSVAVSLAAPKAQSQTHLTFTTVDVRGATHSEANGVSLAGEIVGFYVDSKLVEHGFKDVNRKITTINFPGSTGTRAYGIDLNAEFIVGSYTDSNFTPHGFQLNSSGKFTTVDVPGAAWTRAMSVNTAGSIVGTYADSAGVVHGFLDKNGKGSFTTLDFPGAVLTEIHGIVNLRYMAGIFVDSSGIEHGVQGASGALVSAITVPGAGITSADGVNDAINIVGHFGAGAAGPFHGYLFMRAQFQTIDFPGATDTRCNGINDVIEIVGRYTDVKGVVHGFLAK
jgi:hypothetical protein